MKIDKSPCSRCEKENRLSFNFTMAFQPIINCTTQRIVGYEALVRGLNNESAAFILSQVHRQDLKRQEHELDRKKASIVI